MRQARIWGITAAGLVLGLLTACIEQGRTPDKTVAAGPDSALHGRASTLASPRHRQVAFAGLPDRGELLSYGDRTSVRRQGPYTWYPVNLSEDHALRAIASGEMRVAAPDGRIIALKYERHVEHPDGNWTWIGRAPDGQDAVLTFGESAVFGSIPNGLERPLRLTMGAGRSWLVESDRRQIAQLNNSATRPTRPDVLLPPLRPRLAAASSQQASSAQATAYAGATALATTSSTPTVDVAIGYTAGFASSLGGQSQAVTRINNLIDITNQAYVNSQVNARVRLVRTLQVNYPDATDNGTALEDLTGYRDGSAIPVPAALQPLRDARETSGADLVSLVRDFRMPENSGCGIAWILGFAQQELDQSWADFGYSVVSDGSDYDETQSGNYYCRDETLAHELGHNMGSAHDRDTAKGDDGVLDPEDYGRYPYSFGYKAAMGNFYTVMAYGDSGQTGYRVFSNPQITFCGTNPCGIADQADNARSLTQTIPIIAQFRASTGTFGDVPPTYWAYTYIEKLFAAGITGGCSTDPRLYCPTDATLRDSMAVFLLRAKHGSAYQPPAATGIFSDVPTSYWAAAWIERLYAEGISGGCQASPLKYCPTASVRRDQMAVFLLRAKHGSNYVPPAATGVFADVPTSYWAAAWIEQLAAEGITGGCTTTPKQYCPTATVTRDQMAVFLVRTFNL